ncbi:MAG: hypothetical protein ACREBC_06465, partial [Pyrinomonadaceae bacterium]
GVTILLSVAFGLLILVGFDTLSGLMAALGLGALAGALLLAQLSLWLPAAKQLLRGRDRARSVG